mmetsp:Transcript_48762/g.116915  ORF Transcript_48762/g.116915 Transcript_48762/m.116915 type:complete len:242 (-) Transcript_48762:59-784(-)
MKRAAFESQRLLSAGPDNSTIESLPIAALKVLCLEAKGSTTEKVLRSWSDTVIYRLEQDSSLHSDAQVQNEFWEVFEHFNDALRTAEIILWNAVDTGSFVAFCSLPSILEEHVHKHILVLREAFPACLENVRATGLVGIVTSQGVVQIVQERAQAPDISKALGNRLASFAVAVCQETMQDSATNDLGNVEEEEGGIRLAFDSGGCSSGKAKKDTQMVDHSPLCPLSNVFEHGLGHFKMGAN